uniref:SZT2 subunit of KICSTOR complex n=1 Tax=Xiphophorus maculatus TaxID=8083 RepID=A0A3B5QJK0_XIPMA
MSGNREQESHSCIVQYILFPPHSTFSKDSFSTDDDNDTEVEAVDMDTELNLVTECWVEPQSGSVMNCMDQHRHFQGLIYQDIPQAIFPRDLACMSTMMTFEYLNQLCQNKDQTCSLPTAHKVVQGDVTLSEDSIQMVPFQFDLIQLLPSCQQVELFFLTFNTGVANEDLIHSTSSPPNELLLSLFHTSLEQELSDREVPLAASDYSAFSPVRESDCFSPCSPASPASPSIPHDGALTECLELPGPMSRSSFVPQWRCYAKYVNSQQLLLTFLPASFSSLLTSPSESHTGPIDLLHVESESLDSRLSERDTGTPSSGWYFDQASDPGGKEGVQFSEPQKEDLRISFSRQVSQQSTSDSSHLRCPVYVYNCSLEHLKEQLIHPNSRSLSQDRNSPSPWADLLSQPYKHKELANYCSLLQEHYHQSYVKGVFRSLQQSYSISSQDILLAMDYCEESLQEIDVTAFLQTLCGHMRVFRESGKAQRLGGGLKLLRRPATFCVGEVQEERAELVTVHLEPGFEDKFLMILSQYFKSVPSNPYYYFYFPLSSKKEVTLSVYFFASENMPGCCLMESDTDLVVEYEDHVGTSSQEEGEECSQSDSNTVNHDQDSFSILDGESLLEAEGPQLDMPPLFLHVTCSVNMNSSHGSMPIQTLPTCLGEVISCLDNVETLQSVDLTELSVTLDVFVLTLPLEIEFMADYHHNRSVEESKSLVSGDPLSKFPLPHKLAILATLDEIRWLLQDEIVSALCHSRVINSATLLKVAEHVLRSSGRPHCHCEDVPLQFVFGPEQSLEKFREARPYPESYKESYNLRIHISLNAPVTIYQAPVFDIYRKESKMDQILFSGCSRLRPSRVQSVVSSQGSLDSDMQGYDGGSSDSESEGPIPDDQEGQSPSMPDFWLIVNIHQDRVTVYSHARKVDEHELPEFLQLHQTVVRRIGEVCRIVNQRMLLQDLHDSHVCNTLLVAESEEDIWKNDSLFRQRQNTTDDYNTEESYQARDYLAATMQFIPGHFACDVVWSTVIHIHPRLKMGPNMGVSRAIQALRSVLNSFSVVNRKNMFVYQERTTKSVFYLRSSLEGSRPVGQVDKHILLLVHGVRNAGPEITDELVKVLRKRLDETTLDIITVMLVRNCKLTPADVEFIQPTGSPPTGIMTFNLPTYCLPWLPTLAHYLRQNLLIFLHIPKYTDNISVHHFKHYFHLSTDLADSDIYLYNKPGGQGTGGKGNNILTAQLNVRFDIWEQGNISPIQLSDKLQGALRHALCDAIMELRVLRNPLCLGATESSDRGQREGTKGVNPLMGTSTPESTTPNKISRRSFWDILSKPDSAELGSPKTTDDIVQEKGEEGRAARRRHKTENVKQQWSQERAVAVELEQAQRRQVSQLEEGDAGTLHPVYQDTCQSWITFMARLGCPSIQHCTTEIASNFLLPSILTEIDNLVSSLASDTTVKSFERMSCPRGDVFFPFPLVQHRSHPPDAKRSFILIGRNFYQWHCCTEQGTHLLEFISVTLYSYNWSVDLGASLNRELVRLVKWQNARAHVVHCLFNQKMGLFHHYCFSDPPLQELDSKLDPNPFLSPSMEPDALLRSAVAPLPSKEQGRLGGPGRSLAPLHFPSELLPFDEALRDVCTIRPLTEGDVVVRHSNQLLEMKTAERREMEKQMKIENLFVTWQQRSAQSNMPISGTDLETLKQSSRLVHYCATPLLFDPGFRNLWNPFILSTYFQKRHRSSDSTSSGRDRSYSTDSADMLPSRIKEEPWLLEISNNFLQQYIQYLQSMGFILVQVRPPSPARSSMSLEGRMSFSYVKQKSEDNPKTSGSGTTSYHLQRALPGGIVLMELAFQGCYFCVKQYALECSRIPMGQTVNSQLSMLFTEECDKVRDLMHVHSFSYDFHLRVAHQYLVGCHMTLRQGYQLTDFLDDFICHYPDIPKFGRNHIFQGSFSVSTGIITAHQLYNYITEHTSTYGMKPLRMSKTAVATDNKKGMADLHEYALVALWNSSGSYKDLEGLHHHDDFDVSLVVCHNAVPFEEQSDGERHLLRLRFYVIMTSQRELFPHLTADMRRFKKLPQIYRDPNEQAPSDGNEFYPLTGGGPGCQGLVYSSPLFPLLNNEVALARKQIQASVEQAMGHCRRDNLWKRLVHGDHVSVDKLKLAKLSFTELEELLEAVQSHSVGDIDPQLDYFLTMSPAWYQSLIKVLLSRFPQSCRHFDDNGIQYLAVLNQKFTDCFVLVFLDAQAGKTSLKVVFREPLPSQPQASSSPPPQLVSMYHHLESVINTACYNLWTGLL